MCNNEIQSEHINELAIALCKAQGMAMKAKEDSKNPFFKSTYADLESVWEACRDALTSNDLAVTQTIQRDENGMYLVTTLIHKSGQWMRSFAPIPVTKQDAQSIGSAITYMRRYSLSAMVGIATTDDDGNAATKNSREPEKIISKEKADKLNELLSQDEEYAKAVLNTLKKNFGVQNIYKLPESLYKRVLKSAESKFSSEEEAVNA